jgi:Ca2+-transporting ATPase
MSNEWWTLPVEEVARRLKSDPSTGISAAEAASRLSSHGPNRLNEQAGPGPLSILLEQFGDFMVWVLAGAALISGFLGEWIDAGAILAIVVLNAILGFVQQYRAEKSLAALRKLSAPSAHIVREGQHLNVSTEQIVPGDLLEMEAGGFVPADARIVWSTANLAVQEASLTGESQPVTKTFRALDEPETPLADRGNMIYRGTSITAGKGRALVTATGMGTELGRIASLIQNISREDTPLQRKLEEFGKWIVVICVVLVAIIAGVGILRGGRAIDIFLTAVSLAVAAIPEGLPAVVTIALALGVRRMVRRHALIRKLPSVETLGCATVICTDKTGTLTKNEMTVRAAYVGGSGGSLFRVSGAGYAPRGEFSGDGGTIDPAAAPGLIELLSGGVLCNGGELTMQDGLPVPVGDPTEVALLVAAAKAGLHKAELEAANAFVDEIPFDSDRKRMSMIRRREGLVSAHVKGAPDILLPLCTRLLESGVVRPMTPADREAILAANDRLADEALRVLAFANKPLGADVPAAIDAGTVEQDLVFTGLMAMIDPPRDEVRDAVARCREAGIRAVMITGDHRKTAVAIARELGFFTDNSTALLGEELDLMDEETLGRRVEEIAVYARVTAEHKLRIVRAWKARGHVVAMTGDGVNDAPAVKEANIGVAMGIAGTDVTKEVSDMVVTDDNFASIVSAVEEGRGIYDNIRKFVHYLLSCNAGEIMVMFTATLAGLPSPLLPIHILWVNLVTDSLPALALGVDPINPKVMKQPPRKQTEKVITNREAGYMMVEGSFIALCSLTAFMWVWHGQGEYLNKARTMAFLVLAYCQDFHSYNCRSRRESIFTLGVFSNPQLVMASAVSLVMQLVVIYTPFMQRIFKTEALGLSDWAVVVGLASLPLWAMELVKVGRRRWERD